MWTPEKNDGEQIAEQPSLALTFRHVHRFILHPIGGDTAAAKAMFEDYLADRKNVRARRPAGWRSRRTFRPPLLLP
jgi:hypothetical protein